MQRSFFFSKNGPVDPYRKIFLVKDHIPTYIEKLITFRIPPGLIKMYVLAAVFRRLILLRANRENGFVAILLEYTRTKKLA